MEDFIIIGIIAVAIAVGVIFTVKHFKGEGGCCGGGSYKPKRKKLSGVKYQNKFKVDGMHCEHCKNRVEEVVNDITGVAGRVDLKKGELTVLYAKDVDDDTLQQKYRLEFEFQQQSTARCGALFYVFNIALSTMRPYARPCIRVLRARGERP